MSQSGYEAVVAIVHEVLRSQGSFGLGEGAFMEPRFKHNFSKIRIHADSRAAESAQSVNAHAYIVGQHMAFREGQYSPGTNAGRQPITRELPILSYGWSVLHGFAPEDGDCLITRERISLSWLRMGLLMNIWFRVRDGARY